MYVPFIQFKAIDLIGVHYSLLLFVGTCLTFLKSIMRNIIHYSKVFDIFCPMTQCSVNFCPVVPSSFWVVFPN